MSINATTAAATTGSSGTTPTNPKATLGKDDFLKLLVSQMAHQDPMQPSDSNQSITEMTQFSMLEQITNMATTNQQLVTQLSQTQSLSLLGKTVTYLDPGGAPATGTVDQVDVADGGTTLTVGGAAGIDPAWITQVS